MRNLLLKVVNAIVKTRFVPMETLIGIGGVVIGTWFVFAGSFVLPGVFGGVAALWLAVVGALHLYGLSKEEDETQREPLRRFACFFEFINFSYVAILLVTTFGLSTFGWFAYLLIALMAGTAYLSLAVDDWVGEQGDG